jgi:predicted DNA-binding transcriptional regulator YafY
MGTRTPDTAVRLITLLMLMQRQPNQKAACLAGQLNVSVRTLHRYVAMLEQLGIPVYTERGPDGGFSLVRGFKLPPLVFTPEEAAALCLGTSLVEELWGRLYQQAARGAMAKLANLLPEAQRQEVGWAQRNLVAVGLQRPGQSDLAERLVALRDAARNLNRVELLYQGSQGAPTRRQVDPYALAYRWGYWYLIGHCHLRRGLRSFRLDRIQELTTCQERFEPPEEFNPLAFLERDMQDQPHIHASLRFAPRFSFIAHANRFTWETIEEQPDGGVVVGFSAPDMTWAASMALSFGPAVEVLSPPALRQQVAEWAAVVAEMNTSVTASLPESP